MKKQDDSYKSCKLFAKWTKLINDQETAIRNNQIRHDAPLCHDLGIIDYVENPDLTRYYEYIDHYQLDTYKYSNEVPVNKSFHDMGLCEYDNAPMDVNQEGRYLREFCVQRTSPPANHFLHFRTLTDLRSKHEHQDPEKLMTIFTNLKLDQDNKGKIIEPEIDRTELPYDLCHKWAESNRLMQINRKFFIKIIRQMKHMSAAERENHVDIMCEHAEDMERRTMYWINNINAAMVEKADRQEQMELLSDYYQEKEHWHVEDEEDYEYWEDKIEDMLTETADDTLDRKDSSNPYSTNRLFNGNESLSWQFQQKIANADMNAIKKMQANMFPQKRTFSEMNDIIDYFEKKYGTTPKMKTSNKNTKPLWKKGVPVYDKDGKLITVPTVSTGLKYKPPAYSYFTRSMVSHFWTLIKLRKAELNQETVKEDKLSETAQTAMKWIRDLGKGQLTCTIINNAIKGENTDAYGIQIQFNEKLNRQEANTLWTQYKSM